MILSFDIEVSVFHYITQKRKKIRYRMLTFDIEASQYRINFDIECFASISCCFDLEVLGRYYLPPLNLKYVPSTYLSTCTYSVRTEYRNHDSCTYLRLKAHTFRVGYHIWNLAKTLHQKQRHDICICRYQHQDSSI